MTCGASSDDWQHFAEHLRLQADLLPVVSNATARISPTSKLRDLGKTPSRYDAHGMVVGIPKWTQMRASNRDIGRWSQHGDLGICVQTRTVRAIDIDIADPVRAAAVRDLIELMVLLPQRRRANSGKCLLAFRMPGDFAKRVIRTADGIIEFLATGQQFIAVGTHPSGARYEWLDSATGELGLPSVVPELTPVEFDVLWQALADAFALEGGAMKARHGIVPSVPRLASDLQDPAVAWLDENGWVTGFERDGRVDVRCPWEDGHSTQSGPSSTSYFPAGVGGFAQGHFRCLHASCTARTDGDFFEAVGYAQADFEVVKTLSTGKVSDAIEPLPPFQRDRAGAPLATLNNVLMATRRPDLCGYRIGFDQFLDLLMIGPPGGTWRPFTDVDYTTVRGELESKGFRAISAEMMKEVVRKVGFEQRFDSAVDWSRTLTWDGIERVAAFFPAYFGTEDTPYTRAVGRYTWSALAGRCVEPGVKADMAPVLIGLQGAGKTSAVEVLSPIPEAFVEINLEKKDEDIARSLRGKLVGEIAELRGLQSRDAEAIKAWVSRRTEEWTPKYREFATRFARRLLLIGTGNKDQFLDDDTGERRWLPMNVGTVVVDRIKADRDQLWAEGLAIFRLEGVAWQDAYSLAKAEHHKFKVGDPWLPFVEKWLVGDDIGAPRDSNTVRMDEVLLCCLGFTVQKITRKDELRAGKVLRALGFENKNKRIDGVQRKVWERAEKSTDSNHVERAEKSVFDDLA